MSGAHKAHACTAECLPCAPAPPLASPPRRKQHPGANLLMGGAAGTMAATACYPLDTIRRRMQMRGQVYASQADAFATIWRTEGLRGFYRGWAANSLKVIPQVSGGQGARKSW